ncbi:MAG: DMT family transporter [Patescibacteria group bacterium]
MIARRLHAYILLVIVAVIWGVAASVIKFTQQGIPTLPFLTYRFGIAAFYALLFFFVTKSKLPNKLSDLWQLTIYGLLMSTVSLGLLFWGVQTTSIIEMNIITSVAPLITSIIGVKLLSEHITKREKVGLGIAMAGTLFTIFEPLVTNHGQGIHVVGNLLIFLYVLVNAFASLLGKRLLRKKISADVMTNFGFIVGFTSIAAISVYQLGSQSIINSVINLDFKYHLGVLYMALISGTLAYTLVNKAQKTIEIGEVAVFSYLLPIFGIPTAVLWLGEKITPGVIIGGMIIAIGVAIAETKKRRYN